MPRARADRGALRRAAQLIAGAKRPVIIAGGGVIYSAATDELADFAAKTGIPVGVTQAGKAACPTTTRRWSTRSAPPGRCSPTPWPTRPT